MKQDSLEENFAICKHNLNNYSLLKLHLHWSSPWNPSLMPLSSIKIKILSILAKPKLIDLMAKGYVITRIHKKSSLDNSKMGSWKAWVNCTLPVVITIWDSLNLIKRMEGVCINGQASSQICMKDNL